MNQPNKTVPNWLLVSAVILLAIAPLTMVKGGKFSGSDDRAKEAIAEIQPGYKPWFSAVMEPASSEVSSLLFATQAALGAGIVGYVIGLYKGRSGR